jgi:hypothetical protein
VVAMNLSPQELELIRTSPVLAAAKKEQVARTAETRKALCAEKERIARDYDKQALELAAQLRKAQAAELEAFAAWDACVVQTHLAAARAMSAESASRGKIGQIHKTLRETADPTIWDYIDELCVAFDHCRHQDSGYRGPEFTGPLQRAFAAAQLARCQAYRDAHVAAEAIVTQAGGHDAANAIEAVRRQLAADLAKADKLERVQPDPAIAAPTNQMTHGPHTSHQEL